MSNGLSKKDQMVLEKKYVVIENPLPPFSAGVLKKSRADLNTTVYYFKATNAQELESVTAAFEKKYWQYIIGFDGVDLADLVMQELIERSYTLSAAESCTGGLLISRLIGVPNASVVIKKSFIVYSNEAKMSILGVDKSLIERCGVASSEVALAMAEGLQGSTVKIAVTGYAKGIERKKTDGLFYYALILKDRTYLHNHRVTGTRNEIRFAQTTQILWHLLKILREERPH